MKNKINVIKIFKTFFKWLNEHEEEVDAIIKFLSKLYKEAASQSKKNSQA